MGLIATAHITHPKLSLTSTIRATDASIQVVSHPGTDPETGMFFFLVELDDTGKSIDSDDQAAAFSSFENALAEDATVEEFSRMSETERNAIYRISHPPETKLLTPETIRTGGMMTDAHSSENGWVVTLQLPDWESMSELGSFCEDEGIAFDLYRVYTQDEWELQGTTGLTQPQREALVAAYEAGYFEEPRETSQEQLADILDISPTATGGRLRRGMATLIETTLISYD